MTWIFAVPLRMWLWLLPLIVLGCVLSFLYWLPMFQAIAACAAVRCLG